MILSVTLICLRLASFLAGVPQDVIDLYIAADIAKNKEDKRLILEAMGLRLLLFIELIMKINLNVRI